MKIPPPPPPPIVRPEFRRAALEVLELRKAHADWIALTRRVA